MRGRSGDASHDGEFERRVFVDGLVYLARALPRDLGEDEAGAMARSLPPVMRDNYYRNGRQGGDLRSTGMRDSRSLLHRAVQALVVLLILTANFLAPFLVRAARSAADFNRRHRVSARAGDQAIVLLSCAARTAGAATAFMLDSAAAAGDDESVVGYLKVDADAGGGVIGRVKGVARTRDARDEGALVVRGGAGGDVDAGGAVDVGTAADVRGAAMAIVSDGRIVAFVAYTARYVFSSIAGGFSDGAREGLWNVRFNAQDPDREVNELLERRRANR